MHVVSPLLLVWAAAGPPAAAGAPESARAEALVRQLASPRYRDRELASVELIQMGRGAKSALVAGKSHPDPEVQNRCQQILPQALALDLKHRVDRFLADPAGRLDHDLPLLKRFRDQVGADDAARQLYTDMLTANAALMEAVEEEPARVADRVQQRAQEVYLDMFGGATGGRFRVYKPGAVSATELCVLLFVASTPAYKPAQPDWVLGELYAQPPFAGALKDPKKGGPYRKLFFAYLDARMDDNTLNQCVWMLTQHRLSEGADVVARALRGGKLRQVYMKATALCCIGTLGTREHLSALEPFLNDDTQVQPFFVGRGERGAVQLRDVALAMSIHLSGRNPKDYGFRMWSVFPNQIIQYQQLGFGSDVERAAAFRQWREEAGKAGEKK
jgi:hypothetical protein